MKILVAAILAAALIYGFMGLAEAGVFTGISTRFKENELMGPAPIPLPGFMFLLVVGIIGFQGIRRKG